MAASAVLLTASPTRLKISPASFSSSMSLAQVVTTMPLAPPCCGLITAMWQAQRYWVLFLLMIISLFWNTTLEPEVAAFAKLHVTEQALQTAGAKQFSAHQLLQHSAIAFQGGAVDVAPVIAVIGFVNGFYFQR